MLRLLSDEDVHDAARLGGLGGSSGGNLIGLAAVRAAPGLPDDADPVNREPATLQAVVLRAAVSDDPRFQVDERELRRRGPSYTVLTLEELRAERGEQPVVLILGMDAFAGIDRWHRAEDLINL